MLVPSKGASGLPESAGNGDSVEENRVGGGWMSIMLDARCRIATDPFPSPRGRRTIRSCVVSLTVSRVDRVVRGVQPGRSATGTLG
jgi:hypothetical protein